ncbi:MAG TPA: hypothetical protein PKW62_03450 [Chitinophagaceae bacterium]|nr:hypothetical protein [Chitinophagaceae bacterium]
MQPSFTKEPSSFRDPSGYIFEKDGCLFRQVNQIFKEEFDFFNQSGCYQKLVDKGLLIPHKVINENLTGDSHCYTTLQPEPVPFITYPYEWSFDMLKDAALLTLRITKEAMASKMILKDATPFNIQWYRGKLIFIDTLSFEKYDASKPWIAYRQFCECFLSPLLIMHYKKITLQNLMLSYPDGIPVTVTKNLLPRRTKLSLHLYLHIHLQAKYAGRKTNTKDKPVNFSEKKMINILTSLETVIKNLKSPTTTTVWSDYYEEAAQRNLYIEEKKSIIREWINHFADIKTALDVGANDGLFSKLTAQNGIYTIAADADHTCVNALYNYCKLEKVKNIQPMTIDFSNPTPAIGFNLTERKSLFQRVQTDLVLALAFIHHLVFTKNISFIQLATLFTRLSKKYLLIEFVPKDDPKVQEMLLNKPDIYPDYLIENFENAFSATFTIVKKQSIANSGRTLYLMEKQ